MRAQPLCFCIPSRWGVLILGYFHAILAGFGVIACMVFMGAAVQDLNHYVQDERELLTSHPGRVNDTTTVKELVKKAGAVIMAPFSLGLCCTLLALCIVFIIGVMKNKKILIKGYLISTIVIQVIGLVIALSWVAYSVNENSVTLLAFLVIEAYFDFIIWSYCCGIETNEETSNLKVPI